MYGKTTGTSRYGSGAYKASGRKLDREPWHGAKPLASEAPTSSKEAVQNKKASDLEARVYRALRRLGWGDDNIEFQTPILGGRMPGGAVLDFVVWSPSPIIIEVNGDYWHTRSAELIQRGKEREAKIREAWYSPFKYVQVGSGEILDDTMTYNRMLREVGRG